jgi:hypothetical protein
MDNGGVCECVCGGGGINMEAVRRCAKFTQQGAVRIL